MLKQEKSAPVVATMGEATFFQAGAPGLAQAVQTGARFILVILDRESGDNKALESIPELARSCGVRFIREINPCDQKRFRHALDEAAEYAGSEVGGVAVIVASPLCGLSASLEEQAGQVQNCEKCCEGFPIESQPVSIFELAQKVAVDKSRLKQK